jgi:hypothetical protein
VNRIPVAGPSITEREVAYVADAAKNAWYERAGDYHDRFEAAFRAYVGRKHAMALPSCTSALHLALASLGVGPGDEVIVPDVTWIGTSAPIDYVGATVVFADIDPVTWCLSPEAVRACMTERTRAVIAVDLYGGVPDYAGLRAVLEGTNIPLIEDAAEAIGASYGGAKAGALGDVGTFSFHGSKTLTTGEGGMLVSDRDDLSTRASMLRDHGRAPGDVGFLNAQVAFKYKMSGRAGAPEANDVRLVPGGARRAARRLVERGASRHEERLLDDDGGALPGPGGDEGRAGEAALRRRGRHAPVLLSALGDPGVRGEARGEEGTREERRRVPCVSLRSEPPEQRRAHATAGLTGGGGVQERPGGVTEAAVAAG